MTWERKNYQQLKMEDKTESKIGCDKKHGFMGKGGDRVAHQRGGGMYKLLKLEKVIDVFKAIIV